MEDVMRTFMTGGMGFVGEAAIGRIWILRLPCRCGSLLQFAANNADLLREIFGLSFRTKPTDSAVSTVFSYLA